MLFADYDIALLPPQASYFAVEYDLMFWYVTAVIAFGGTVVYAMLAWFCFAYADTGEKRQTPRILGSTKIEIVWTLVPLMFFLTFFVWGVRLYNVKLAVPADAKEYYVVGKQWMWKIQHPEGQREINEWHIPVNTKIKMIGTSEDVIHDFGIPAFRNKFDVVPGRYFTTWYLPTQEGTYHIFCDQYCGQGHSQMVGKVHVMGKEDHENWLAGTYRPDGGLPVDGSLAWRGRKLFLKLQCNSCHNAGEQASAPRLEELYMKRRPVQGGQWVVADDNYLKLSIRNPTAHVADGWQKIMPAFGTTQVTDDELNEVIAYIKSLKIGDLPVRTEQAPRPIGAPVILSEGK